MSAYVSRPIQQLTPAHLPFRDRVIIMGELGAITSLAWLYLVKMPMAPADLGGVAARILSPLPPPLADLWLTFMMWAVMMVAMMLPSATPMILTYARVARGRDPAPNFGVAIFAAGYVVIWTAFSAAATVAQAALQHASIISGALRTDSIVGGAILIATGIYQLTPLKEACLGHCQSPLGFFMTRWRDGAAGAFRMGLDHGAFCVGCCWMLMGLLFVAGVMNLTWVAAITGFVLLEKLLPYPRAVATSAGLVLLVSGVILAIHG